MNFKNKFEGALSDVNIEQINQDLIQILIDRNIYYLDNNLSFTNKDLFFQHRFEKTTEPSVEEQEFLDEEELNQRLCGDIYFSGNRYKINPLIIDEIYSMIDFYVNINDCLWEIKNIDFKVKQLLPDEKDDFLRLKYKSYFEKINNENTYLIYVGEDKDRFPNWKSYVYSSLEDDSFLIEQFLTDKIIKFYTVDEDGVNFSIVKNWKKFREVHTITEHCLKLLNNNTKNESTSKFSARQKFILFEELRQSDKFWEDSSDRKKSLLLSNFMDVSERNLRGYIADFDGKNIEITKKDQKVIQSYLKSLGDL